MKRNKTNKKNIRLDEYQEKEIEDLLKLGKPEREIATLYKCKIGEIYKIKARMPYVTNEIVTADEEGVVEENTDIRKAEMNLVNIDDLVIKSVNDSSVEDADQEETNKPKRKRISQDTKEKIFAEFRKGTKAEDIISKYDISAASVYRLKCQYKEMHKEAVEGEVTIFDPKKLLKIQNESYIKVGLVADRHNINPVKDYIFDGFDSELMFNYEEQFEIAKKEIKDKIPFNNGKPIKGLMLYATGLQAALVSVIKVCEEMGIPLVVMHYNAEDQAYYPQNYSVENDVIAKVPTILDNYVKKVRLLQLYNCMPEDLNDATNILEVKECFYDSPIGSINRSIVATDSIIFINKSAAWDYFRIKAEEALPSKSIFINIGSIDKGKYISGKSIARITN